MTMAKNAYPHQRCSGSGPAQADGVLAARLSKALRGSLRGQMTAERVCCARQIVGAVEARRLPKRAAVIATTTAIVESTLLNVNRKLDHTSLGLFQQQDPWGSRKQRLNPKWATNAFLNAMLKKFPRGSWQRTPVGTVCQKVQVSAFPGRYRHQAKDASTIVAALWRGHKAAAPDSAAPAEGVATRTLRGVDVSSFQGDINWRAVREAGYVFGFAKATEGRDFRDPRFTAGRWKAMADARIVRGAYHFARPQPGRSGRDEARWFCRVVQSVGGRRDGDLPLCLDVEWAKGLNPQQIVRWCSDFCAEVKRQTGRGCIVYTGGFWKNLGRVPAPKQGEVLWIAHYGVKKPQLPAGWKTWTFWQFSDKGRVPGISGPVDVNYFNGNLAALNRLTRGADEAAEPAQRAQPAQPAEPAPPAQPQPAPVPSNGAGYPAWLPAPYRPLWARPWDGRAARHPKFRALLDQRGYLSPHFRSNEARCKDGTGVPRALMRRARDHAFALETLRHRLGGRPIPVISWYRTPTHNRKVGGSRGSKHMQAIATDHPRGWVDRIGRARVLREGNVVFARGGMGVYPSGSLHFDSRGARARWSSFRAS
jgi:GH25 family lysozyme M1 (1,4-beta-N-acetylmuramidase)